MTLAQEVMLRLEIEDFHTAYGAALDDGRYDAWPDFFASDCIYRIVPRDNHDANLPLALMHCEGRGMLIDRVASLRETLFYLPRTLRHMVSGIRVKAQAGGEIVAEANYLVLQTDSDKHTEVFNYGRYLDRFTRHQGELRLQERICVFDSLLVPSSLMVPL
jgi:3-phenylpropionate/cinnamic acid dioxygenase small subunit